MTHNEIAVLLIEDNPGDARLIELALGEITHTAYRLTWADTLARGLERLAEQPCDVALLDLSLPDSRGLETVRRVRERFPKLPVVVLTGQNDTALALELLRAGAQDYLVKDYAQAYVLDRAIRYALERAAIIEELHHRAFHDTLTGLPNRAAFQVFLRQAMARGDRDPQYRFAVLFLDLDRFKEINDSLGHQVGDQMLIELVKRLQACLRPTEVVARLGGDEFVILLDGQEDRDEPTRVAERVLETAGRRFLLDGHEVYTSLSIGIVAETRGYRQPEDLLRDADIAMYRAKSAGRAGFVLYEPSMHEQTTARLKLITELHRALRNGGLQLHYQPVLATGSGRVVGIEALLRWPHPDGGVLLPAEFLPLADEHGLMPQLGEWTVRTAIAEFAAWEGNPGRRLIINCFGRELIAPRVLAALDQALADAGLPPERIEIDLAAGGPVSHPRLDVEQIIHRLHERGLRIGIDNFGIGASSLASLKQLPVSVLKISPLFTAGLGRGSSDEGIVAGVISIAHGMGRTVVGKGVETAAQLEFLRAHGCDEWQGHHYAAAAPLAELTARLRREEPPPLLADHG